MKRILTGIAAVTLSMVMLTPLATQAQEEKKKDPKKEKDHHETIIITRKSDKDEKYVIEFKGDKVIVNGKDAEDADGDIIVHRNRLRDMSAMSAYQGMHGMNEDFSKLFTTDENRARLGVVTEKNEGGAQITEVLEDGAAKKAGLKEGDIINKLGDKKIETPDALTKAIQSHKPGDKVAIGYLRDKRAQSVNVELGKWQGLRYNLTTSRPPNMDMRVFEAMPGNNFNVNYGGRPKLGISVQDTDDGKGVKVIDVDDESTAQKAGLREEDIITHINDKEVNSTDEVTKIVRENRENASMSLKIQRSGKSQTIEVKIPRKIKTANL